MQVSVPGMYQKPAPYSGADPHIFDRLGLDRKIGRLRAADGEKAAAEPRIIPLTNFM